MKPRLRFITLDATNTSVTVPKGEYWLILDGVIDHFTGTASTLSIEEAGLTNKYLAHIDAALPDAVNLPLGRYTDTLIGANHYFGIVPYQPIMTADSSLNAQITFSGDANRAAGIEVLVFKLAELEKIDVPLAKIPPRMSGWQ